MAQPGGRATELPSIAWRPVLFVAGLMIAGLLILSPVYGWHRDELYFVVAGRHPALGYVDQPPFTPLLSAATVALLGTEPWAIRLLPAVVAGAYVILAALIARTMGGPPRAQALAALVVALSGYLFAAHFGNTATYDLLAWAAILWLVARLLGGADPRTWIVVGVVAGLGLQNKHLVLFLGAGLAAGVLLDRRWELLRSPWLWAGAAVAFLIWLPNLAWQAANGFPQLEMAARIGNEADENRVMLIPELLLLSGPLLFPVSVVGAVQLLRDRDLRPWRPIGTGFLAILVLVLASGGKSYYAGGMFVALMAAGALSLDRWLGRGRRLRAGMLAVAATASGLLIAVLGLPVLPAATLAETPIPDINKENAESVGWPELVATVEGVADGLSPEDRARAVILTSNYGELGAIELLGEDLPPVYSGHNSTWDWGPPPDDRTVTIAVGGDPRGWGPWLGRCEQVATITNDADIANEENGAPVLVCRQPPSRWSDVWSNFRHLS